MLHVCAIDCRGQLEQSDEPVDENEDLVNDGVHLVYEDLYEDIIIKYVS